MQRLAIACNTPRGTFCGPKHESSDKVQKVSVTISNEVLCIEHATIGPSIAGQLGVRIAGWLRIAAVVFPLLACAAQASELDPSGVGEQSPLAVVATSSLLPQLLKAWIPPVLEMADFYSPPFLVEFSLLESQASGTLLGNNTEPDNKSPQLLFIALVLCAMVFVRHLFSDRFRDLISDVCSMLLAIQQEGR